MFVEVMGPRWDPRVGLGSRIPVPVPKIRTRVPRSHRVPLVNSHPTFRNDTRWASLICMQCYLQRRLTRVLLP